MPDMLTRHRRNLHQIPEIGYALTKTHAYLLDALKHIKAEIEEVAQTGLALFFDNNKPQTIAFRTDMDALEITEQNDTEYRSMHDGCMHACGHDAHMAMMLVFAEYVDKHIHNMPNNVLLIFQPAEESGGGAKLIADSGILNRYNVRAIYALHVDPNLAIGEVGSRSGAFMAQANEVWLNVVGKSAHVARAEEGIDALSACVAFYDRVNEAVGQYKSIEPLTLRFGLLHSGSAQNIISGQSKLGGTLRTYSRTDFDTISSEISKIAHDIENETGAKLNVVIDEGYPAVINDPGLFDDAKKALFDMPFVTFEKPSLLGEDFSNYLEHVPGLMLFIGVGGDSPLHSPTFDLDERALVTGVEIYKRLSMR